MANLVEVKVPDIGDFTDIPVIEILVKVGDTIKKEDSLVSLESDKATMEVPASHSGVVKEIKLKLGDKVSMGAVVLILEEAASVGTPPSQPALAKTGEGVAAPPAAPIPSMDAPLPPLAGEGRAGFPCSDISPKTRTSISFPAIACKNIRRWRCPRKRPRQPLHPQACARIRR